MNGSGATGAGDGQASGGVEARIAGRMRDLGGFEVRRVLPAQERQRVGPFIFFDHFGPVAFGPGQGMDVRPHPHIGLATVSYLFEGEIVHRDSLGSRQPIRPGDVNWMVAGQGIVHSERTSADVRAQGGRVHGLQCWVALPIDAEEVAPRFEHHPGATLPVVRHPGATLRVVAGSAYGLTAPIGVLSPTLYVDVELAAGAEVPVDDEHQERAVYVVAGSVVCQGQRIEPGVLTVLRPGAALSLVADQPARAVLIGGAPLAGPRHIEWNFVSSSSERIEQAKSDWRERRFPTVPDDAQERIPLPGE
jgi:redox-sensitive bicupin YhaK (pirin superfamily)